MEQPLWETVQQLLRNFSIEYLVTWQFHSSEYTQRIENRDANRYLYAHVPSRIILNSQKGETTQMSINGIDKQMVVFSFRGISFSPKEE